MQNNLYKHYDWSNLITEEDKKFLVKDIFSIIDRGQYWENSPKYQTKKNIFGTIETISYKMGQINLIFFN